jgi:DivIVA domain-containing protein
MTPDPYVSKSRKSPEEIRNHLFGTRLRGLDPDEVSEFLAELADQVARSDEDQAALRGQLERSRSRAPDGDQRAEITAYAVGLLSQAQQIADNLVAEAEQYARDLVAASRDQHREVLQRAQESVEAAVRQFPPAGADGGQVSSAELEYVRTFTQVAHVQLRSVLDALAEQVERLGHLPDVSAQGPPPAPSSYDTDAGSSAQAEVEWWNDLSSTPRPPAMPG